MIPDQPLYPASIPEPEGMIKIVQMVDEDKVLPDGSKIIYAESVAKIVLYQKKPLEEALTYVFYRKTGKITINGKEGNNSDKRKMIDLGTYLITHCAESDLVTISAQKGRSS